MNQLIGEYDCKMDAKGRVRIPTDLIRQFDQKKDDIELIINRGLKKNLEIFPKDVWEEKTNKINQRLNSFNVKHSKFKTLFLSGASRVALDVSDRILISKRLIEHAGLEKEIVLLGTGNSVELWSRTEYDKLLGTAPEDYADLAQDVLGNLDEGF